MMLTLTCAILWILALQCFGTMGFRGQDSPLMVLHCAPSYTGTTIIVMPETIIQGNCYDVRYILPSCNIESIELAYGFCATFYRTSTCDDSQDHENVQWNTTWLNNIPSSTFNHLGSFKISQCSQHALATCELTVKECQATVNTLTNVNAVLTQQLGDAKEAAADANQKAADAEKKYAQMVNTTCGAYSKIYDYWICESYNVNIQCAQNQWIYIRDANYGRLDTTACPSGTTTNTNCIASRAMSIVSKNCNQKNSCNLAADNGVFGDPCPGISKYLLVHYLCLPSEVYNSCSAL